MLRVRGIEARARSKGFLRNDRLLISPFGILEETVEHSEGLPITTPTAINLKHKMQRAAHTNTLPLAPPPGKVNVTKTASDKISRERRR